MHVTAAILKAVRDGNGSPLEIGKRLRLSRSLVYQYLMQLRTLGLIDKENGSDGAGLRFRTTEKWDELAKCLGISLSSLALDREEMRVRPYFGLPYSQTHFDVFTAMPFRPELRPIYDEHVLPVVRKLGLQSKRADDFFSVNSVMEDIWTAINTARVVIADCTGRNPNVFYEIGLAHTIGKPVVLITQSGDDVPFDLKAIRYIEYQYTPPGMRKFEQSLELTLSDALKDASAD